MRRGEERKREREKKEREREQGEQKEIERNRAKEKEREREWGRNTHSRIAESALKESTIQPYPNDRGVRRTGRWRTEFNKTRQSK